MLKNLMVKRLVLLAFSLSLAFFAYVVYSAIFVFSGVERAPVHDYHTKIKPQLQMAPPQQAPRKPGLAVDKPRRSKLPPELLAL